MSEVRADSADTPDEDSVDAPVNEQDGNEDSPQENQSEEAIEAKRIKDTEAALKEKQAEFTRLSQQVAELKGQMSILVDKDKPKDKDWLDDEELKADIVANPESIIKALKALRGEIANMLPARDEYLLSQARMLNPEYAKMQNMIAALKQDPEYEGFSDKQLLVIAKKTMVVDEDEDVRRPPSEIASKRVAVRKQGHEDIKKDPLWKRIYGDQFNTKENK